MTNPTALFNLDPNTAALIARERHSDLLREAAVRRLAKGSRRMAGRTRSRFLRWR